MYSQGYGTQGSDFTNNPFINDPTNPQTRFPAIPPITQEPIGQYNSQWVQSPGVDYNGTAKFSMLGSDRAERYAYDDPIAASTFTNGGYGMAAPTQPGQQFQPSSGFGQQLVAQVNATGYVQAPGQMQAQSQGYPAQYQNPYQTAQQQPQLQYNTGYPAPQQQYNNGLQPAYGQQLVQPAPPAYQDVAQFDPYSSIAQGWGDTTNQSQTSPSSNASKTYNGHTHPREYIRTHKAELEVWDNYAWKQALNAFDVLKDAWAARKKEVESRITQVQRDYGYTGQQEVARLQMLLKEADSNFGKLFKSNIIPPLI